mmetsp:Transcript_13973/g.24501  ORF Transcript_13973/g.24501 Transcript_13973/m.24501 type:complete len:455 (-) Transcript_13973:668-2032(-)|eukprot:CAMPEP_0119104298 /NCGR_PEP_ID=MMETSP1180-20130426/2537_1 /TAXON_ID=3052 ORGANISM="Chlamydomonas cf sp, Strain CCMP681" /NCGR_SAMPLE_ID=MMETSP1180 /ASSEMBLY_ACC=CAM_ASM_000741 /LENGTH=454 /DNA_ID=CAMNT_0007089007 /DNA_START=79 /DNA_END=1443 /DNA_ORIENTATION=-
MIVIHHLIIAFVVAAVLAPFSYYAGLGARLLRLPQITGYLLSGIVCGPYILGILSKESVADLSIIEGACLSIIGLAAGAELDWPALSRSRKQVLGITAAVCMFSWVFCYVAFNAVGQAFPDIMPTSDHAHLLAICTLGATLMMTRSPASAIAVLKEVDGKGAFSSLVMAVVVVKDVVVIVIYALNMELIRAVILPPNLTSKLRMINLILPIVSTCLSMAVGAFGGLFLGVVMRSRSPLLPSAVQSASAVDPHARYKMVVVLLVSTAVFQVAHFFEAEPLLACVTMGMVVVNRKHDRAEKEKEELHHTVTSIMSLTNVAFFGLAGASLKLSAIRLMLYPALIVSAVRLVAIYCGSWFGCFVTGTLPEQRRLFWASMVTQAGVAMGLARLAGTRFPDWGPHFQAFMIAIILVNLLVGPPLFKMALIGMGEARIGAALAAASAGGPTLSTGAKEDTL